MRPLPTRIACALLLAALLPAAAAAQERAARFTTVAAPSAPAERLSGSSWSMMGVGKWTALTASLGAAAYGLVAHADADQQFLQLERACVAEPERCGSRLPDGSFSDEVLEQAYQDVLSLDRRARWALIGAQVGVLGTVALFLLDMRGEAEDPTVIPYRPPGRVEVTPAADGAVRVGLRMPLGGR